MYRQSKNGSGTIEILSKNERSRTAPGEPFCIFVFQASNEFAKLEQESRAAIADLIKIYGPENVAFLHVPQKDEVGHGPNSLGLKARGAIEDAGGKLFDGFKQCQLTSADYYANDNHPNKGGYSKIAACAAKVINQLVAGGE